MESQIGGTKVSDLFFSTLVIYTANILVVNIADLHCVSIFLHLQNEKEQRSD